ncbi:MAG: efflux RND transporter permease subunit [Chitinophagaceae bacterium]
MWYTLGQIIIRNRKLNLIGLLLITAFFGYKASKIQMSYEFSKSIPTNTSTYKDYNDFQKRFGGNGELVVVGVESKNFYTPVNFNLLQNLHNNLKNISAVTDVTSVLTAVHLVKDTIEERFNSTKIFKEPFNNQQQLDSSKQIIENIPLYNSLLYNKQENAYLIGITVNKDSANSKARTLIMQRIEACINDYKNDSKNVVHISGLPYIRTIIADKIKKEMNFFLIGSLLLSALILLIFFRSLMATFMSLLVVGMGVVWCFGLMVLFNFKITLLSALIAPLVVVIGIPNCIYFLNKYHSTYQHNKNKVFALHTMVGKMGVVTLFCNIAAAIGFAVFALTKSALLQEFGIVSGIIIFALFFISLLFIPSVLSYLSAPTENEMRYLQSKLLSKVLSKIETLVMHKSKWVFGVTIIILIISIIGIFKLKKLAYIVDDLPKQDIVYKNLKWFEQTFKGVMPLEIIIDTKKKKGLQRSLQPIEKIDELSFVISQNPNVAKPLSFVDGLKLSKQAFYDEDSNSYSIPNSMAELALMTDYMKPKIGSTETSKKGFDKLLQNFIDSNKQVARISINMKDIGTLQLPILIKDFKTKAYQLFDSTKYNITFTGASITFLEGSAFIIDGLKESIIYGFILISLCMLYLFKSIKILLYSIVPNIIPLIITAGVMGWCGIPLKPSTVLVFSVALGIVIDVTIRFLVNYKQELAHYNHQINATLINTIQHTGISIIYTSLVLVVGFIIFCFSNFGGTQALGWLTSLTLFTGTFTNLILLPALMKSNAKKELTQ